MTFQAVASGLSEETTKARIVREKASLKAFNILAASSKFRDFGELQSWLFTEHTAYSAKRLVMGMREEVDPEVLKTY